MKLNKPTESTNSTKSSYSTKSIKCTNSTNSTKSTEFNVPTKPAKFFEHAKTYAQATATGSAQKSKDTKLKEPDNQIKIFKINSAGKVLLPIVQINATVSDIPLTLLVDSGASVSLIKLTCLTKSPKLVKEIIHLKGIDPGDHESTETLGHLHLKMHFPSATNACTILSHKFHVIDKIHLPFDGIIGTDMLNSFGCNIDYNTNKLTINNIQIPFQFHEPIYSLPPRSETMIECSVFNPEIKEGLVLDQKQSENIFIANCLVRVKENKRINISVINTSDSPVTLKSNLNIKLIPLNQNDMTYIPIHSTTEHPHQTNDSYIRTQEVLNLLRIKHLNTEEANALHDICSEYSDIFHVPGDKLTFTTAVKHEISTTPQNPIHVKSYRFPEIHKPEVAKQIDQMLDQNIIKPSMSPWSSPIWVVPKKMDASGERKWRVVIDYRKLNDITVGDSYPLPQISEILDQLGQSKYFSTLDLASGFHQILMDEKDAAKTAFSVPQGHYEFTRMPFGLKNAPATFQRLMNTALAGLQDIRCFVYLDDVVIYSHDLASHIENLELVFGRLRDFHLKLQPDKCEFLRREVGYLGHVITEEGVKPNPEKIEAVTKFPTPKCPKDIKSFLGLVSYYRRFIPEFSKIAKPLTHLLKKDIQFLWENQQQVAFDELKHKLTSAPVLIYPDFSKPFILTCDASNYAIGAVLSQGPKGQERPIAYASRTLNKSETNYNTTEKELLAVLFGCKTFRPYLYGRKFYIFTDHRPLTWLMNHKDPGSKLQRWRLKLSEYEYEIGYQKGKLNAAADALSRYPVNPVEGIDPLNLNDNISPFDDELNIDFSPLDLPNPVEGQVPLLPNPLVPEITDSDVDLPSNPRLIPDTIINQPSTSRLAPSPANNLPLESHNDNDFPMTTPLTQDTINSEESENRQNTLSNNNYNQFMKTINSKTFTSNAKILESNSSVLKSNDKIIIIPSSIDLDDSNPYVEEIMSEIDNKNEILSKERTLHSYLKVIHNGKCVYFLFTKVNHFDTASYEDIYTSLRNLRNALIQQPATPISITDFRDAFEAHSRTKLYNIILFLFHNTNIFVSIYRNTIIFPSLSEIKKILRENHDIPIAGHLGSVRMLKRIQEKYYWKGMRRIIEDYVKSCKLCQENKALRKTHRAPMQITTTSNAPFQRLAMDIVGPLPESGLAKLKYILTLQDDLTKFSLAYPIRSTTAEETSECLLHFISMFGIPKTILTDQGTNFTSELFKKTCEHLKIKQLWSSPYHPQTQGALERSHSTLKEYLKSFVDEDQSNWSRYIYTAILAYNTNTHSTTNYTPYELIFGHKPFIPDSIYDPSPNTTYPEYLKMLCHRLKLSRDKAVENIQHSKEKSKVYYDNHTRSVKYNVGDLVYLKNHLRLRKALSPLWKGPYKILKVHDNNTATLLINNRHIRHHFDQIKPANSV